MMGANFENIDGIFRKQLRDYTQAAPESVWYNIENSLNAQKKVKTITFYKVAAAIAAFAILGASYFYFTNQKQAIETSKPVAEELLIPAIEKKELKNEDLSETKIEKISLTQNEGEENKSNNLITKAEINGEKADLEIVHSGFPNKNSETRDVVTLSKLVLKKISLENSQTKAEIVDTRKQKIKAILNSIPGIYDDSFTLGNLAEEDDNQKGKWVMGGEFSPLYSYRNITSTTGAYSEDYYNSTENPVMSYSGGLNLQYKAVDRLTIQAGVYYTTMGQSLDYMSVYANGAYDLVDEQYKDRFINTYAIENSSGDLAFNSAYVIVDDKSARVENLSSNKAVADISDPIYSNLDAQIEQKYQYVEVPFLMRYKIIDKAIDINVVGGFGANFLIGNDVLLKYGGNKEIIGSVDGLNSVNYTGTVGFGIEYPVMKRINIHLEPSLRYYINEINSNSTVESHPYSIGIYTGINYSF